ncbi:MAG TPA: hypothetical protein VD731_01775 [Nitrosopumilaceae archaeon]|nr:hypothetical protein [Nitrosopumilaceae archaeon]
MQKTISPIIGIFFLIVITMFSPSIVFGEIEFTNLRPVDFMGNNLNSIQLSQQIQFTSDIKNNNNFEQDFAFIVTTDSLQKKVKWITGRLSPGQTLSPAISFSFDSEKTYQVDAYLTLLPKQILDKNNPTIYSPFAKSENHLASPLQIIFTIGAPLPNLGSIQKHTVPASIRDNVVSWSESKISDIDFLKGIEYLIENNIITPLNTLESKPLPSFIDPQKDPQHYIQRYFNEPSYKDWFDRNYPEYTIYEAVGLPEPSQDLIPDWIRNTAQWWSKGLISDDEFLHAITFLVENDIILVNM